MSRSSMSGAIIASALLLPSLALAQQTQDTSLAVPTSPPRFVEVKGELELRGVLNARPLQVVDAAKYGLTEAQVLARQEKAKLLLSEFPLVEHVVGTDEYLIEVGEGMEQSVAAALMAGGDFQYVTPDWVAYPIASCTTDNLLPNQWHHNADRMNSCAGWGIETGNPSIVVAICDTGVRTTHNDLLLNRVEGYNAVDNKWESNGGQIIDINGHGTATTGCAAANGDNGLGISGTGWNLSHRMMRVSNSAGGGAFMSDLTQAARLASDVGDKVSSVSYSGVTDPSIQTAGTYIRNNGSLLVWAAGNSGNKLTGSREDSVIVVGATTSGDNLSGFSNWGGFVDLVAPGSSVYTTSNSNNNAYGGVSGTSFSCPLTAGLCGLIYAADPSLTPQQVEDILRAGCDDLGATGTDTTFGYGRIDVFGSLSLVSSCGADNYCTALPNSTGTPGSMGSSGSTSVVSNDLTLSAFNLPPGQFGIFFMGDAQQFVGSGDGNLCVGGNLQRFGAQQIGVFGDAFQAIDLNNLPGGVTVLAGDTTNFSFWHRDSGAAGWNFTDGLSVEWCD
jgi:subtilisin family serine protease